MGNTLVECLLEWVEEHVEKLSTRKIEVQNTTIISKIQHDKAKAEYERWLELKKRIQLTLAEKDGDTCYFIVSDRTE
jgi:hypothetical protein